jgi:hypothetical protein
MHTNVLSRSIRLGLGARSRSHTSSFPSQTNIQDIGSSEETVEIQIGDRSVGIVRQNPVPPSPELASMTLKRRLGFERWYAAAVTPRTGANDRGIILLHIVCL